MKKRWMAVIFLLVFALLMSGCSSSAKLMPAQLSESEQQLVNLFGAQNAALIAYQIDGDANSATLQMATYENGESKTDTLLSVPLKEKNGRILIWYQETGNQLYVAVQEKSGLVTSQVLSNAFDLSIASAAFSQPLSQPFTGELTGELPVFLRIAGENGTIGVRDIADYAENPELLKSMQSAQLVTVSFSKTEQPASSETQPTAPSVSA